MGLFKSKAEKQLDSIILRMQMNMSNNYKDNAQDNLKELEEALEAMRSAGNVKAAVIEKYESVVGIYKEKMKEFRHKGKWFLFIVTIIFMACSEKIIWACKV